MIQAKKGDCFLLEYGINKNPKYILIDGGPSTIYDDYLIKELKKIKKKTGKIELTILSHVDDDHIKGLLDYLGELYPTKNKEIVDFETIWFNTFGKSFSIDDDTVDRIQYCVEEVDNEVNENRDVHKIIGRKLAIDWLRLNNELRPPKLDKLYEDYNNDLGLTK